MSITNAGPKEIHQDNGVSQAVARHLGLAYYGQLEPQHWNGQPMHCWADRQPASGQEPTTAPPGSSGRA
jgi:hypothetical protein